MKATLLVVSLLLAAPAAAQPLPPPPLLESDAPAELSLSAEPERPEPDAPRAAAELSWSEEAERPAAVSPGMRVGRILTGTLAATFIGYGTGLAVGVGVYAVACGSSCSGWDGLGVMLGAASLGMIAAAGTVPLGAFLTGRMMGGKGSYGGALAGAAIGLGVTLVSMYGYGMLAPAQPTPIWMTLAVVAAAPLGAALGTEISSARNEPEVAEAQSFRVQPTLAVGPNGGLVGIAARF